jgi:hypothetical protein
LNFPFKSYLNYLKMQRLNKIWRTLERRNCPQPLDLSSEFTGKLIRVTTVTMPMVTKPTIRAMMQEDLLHSLRNEELIQMQMIQTIAFQGFYQAFLRGRVCGLNREVGVM